VKKSIAVLVLVIVACVVYAPAARDGFVWDDTALVLRDPLIRSWRLAAEGFNHFLFVDATPSDFYRPVQRLTYTLDYALFGFGPAGYHVLSVLWHAAAAVALFFFAEELLLAFGLEEQKRRWISFLAALVWAIHPVQSAAVIYVSGRADPLVATFGFLGCYLMLRQIRANGLAKLWFVLAAGIAFLLSAFSKESGLIFPVLALAFFLLRKNWMDVVKTVAVALFVCAIYWSLRSGAEHYPTPTLSAPAPPLVKPIIVARAVAEYTGLLIFPINLRMDREVETYPAGLSATNLVGPAWRELQTLLGILLIAAAIYWMLRSRRRNPAAFACLLFAAITYLPISGIFSLNASVAEHWIYIPSAFVFLAVALEAAGLFRAGGTTSVSSEFLGRDGARPSKWQPKPITKFALLGLFTIWLVFLGARTFIRTFDWKDERTFFQRTIASSGDSARMLINLGNLEMNEGKLEDAAVHFHAALQKKPDQPMALLNLGAIALKQNDFKLASELLNRASKMPPVDAQAYELLAILENKQNKKVDLLRLRLAARTGPPNWSIEKRYIEVLDESGARSAAINELLACLRTQWYRAESWRLLSELETKAGHADQAANALAMSRAYDVHFETHSFDQ
jgi:tetratricopeptide (TPR) repeat protein